MLCIMSAQCQSLFRESTKQISEPWPNFQPGKFILTLNQLLEAGAGKNYKIPISWLYPGEGLSGRERLNAIADAEEVIEFILGISNDELFQDSVITLYQPAAVKRVQDLLDQLSKNKATQRAMGHILRLGYDTYGSKFHHKNFAILIVDLVWDATYNVLMNRDTDIEDFEESFVRMHTYLHDLAFFDSSKDHYLDIQSSYTNIMCFTAYKSHVLAIKEYWVSKAEANIYEYEYL